MKDFLTLIANFYNHPLFIIIGGITVTISFLAVLYKIACWFFNITPIIIRLGTALSNRRVAIFSSTEVFESLKDSLINSKIFTAKRIVHIHSDNLDKAKEETIFLVDWESCGEKIEQVFAARLNQQTPIVIYAKPASIPHEKMNDIANRANTVVVNFRGRLLNDMLTSLVTTTYCK